ncbi:alpha/beta hydrolase family protein [Terribacillus saccharophilus]|nr:hypothetical protein [Terribacillus saccharophilus]
MLLIHEEADLRCPVSQADEMYMVLKRWDKTTKLIRYPDAEERQAFLSG